MYYTTHYVACLFNLDLAVGFGCFLAEGFVVFEHVDTGADSVNRVHISLYKVLDFARCSEVVLVFLEVFLGYKFDVLLLNLIRLEWHPFLHLVDVGRFASASPVDAKEPVRDGDEVDVARESLRLLNESSKVS